MFSNLVKFGAVSFLAASLMTVSAASKDEAPSVWQWLAESLEGIGLQCNSSGCVPIEPKEQPKKNEPKSTH